MVKMALPHLVVYYLHGKERLGFVCDDSVTSKKIEKVNEIINELGCP
jgi:hypothetical protein